MPLTPRPADASIASETQSVPIATQYLRIAIRRKWLILVAVAISILIGIIVTLLATPLYTATTRLEISREGARIVNVEDVQPETSSIDNEFYQTQYSLLESETLAERVAQELRLADDANFFAMTGHSDLVQDTSRGPGLTGDRDSRTRLAVSILRSNVRVSPIRLSRLVDVSWTGPDPTYSARIANAWATAFIQTNLERRVEATAYAREFLERRLEQVRRRLEESERRLVGYASNQEIINIPIEGGSEPGATRERSLTADSLAALNSALAQATADRIQSESRLANASRGASNEALGNATINELRQRRGQLAAEYARMMTQFEPEYPPAVALRAQIQQLDESIGREEGRVQASLNNAYRDSVQRERLLSARMEGLKQTFLDQRRRSIQYNIFQRDVDTNRELYNGLLQRYKEIGVAGGVGSNNVSVVDRAKIPGAPAYPRPFLNLLIALVIGLGVGVGLALLREQMDETLSDPMDLEKQVGVPLLGAIPNTRGADPSAELKDPKSGVTEAYLSVQSSLAFSSDHGIPKSLMVTSSRPGEGKSTSARALAYSIARGGPRTILIDGDMRSPSVHADLGLTNEHGLSNYLAGTEGIETLIQRPAGEPYAVMTAGPQPPNAAELLRGPKLDALIGELLTKFDHVVIDSPPVMGLADAPIIASRTEGTVFVLEAGGVKARIARRALDRLRQGRARLLGAILTKFDVGRAHLGYGYDYGYGYGHDRRYGENGSR